MASQRRRPGPADDDNERFLHEAKQQVARHAWKMKLAKDELGAPGKTRQEVTKNVLKCATDMLLELRTGLLTPRNYYALYNDVTMQLFEFESFVEEVHAAGTPLEELYSLVQACSGNVVPRLYLLITTGAVYIKSKEIAANQILKDLVEMAKGVQHPMRGLFLRYYLSHVTKDKLPDIGTDYETVGGTIEDAIDFVLQNFVEMNKLWVRMQHQRKREKSQAKRETERQALKSVVGTNLMRLAKMNGLDVEMYQTTVLPRLLEQITNCKDKIAQEYLMDCMVQVFPDSFHLATLEDFLQTCTQLKPEVDVADIIKNLMRRLSRDGDSTSRIPSDINAFQIFTDFVHRIITEKSSMNLTTILGLQLALEQFALKNYPGRLDYVDNVLSFCAQFLEKAVGGRDRVDAASSALVLELLSKPLDTLALDVLDPQLAHYTPLTEFLLWEDRKAVAIALLERVLATYDPVAATAAAVAAAAAAAEAGEDGAGMSGGVVLDSDVTVGRLLTFIKPLVQDEPGTPTDEQTRDEFADEQRMVARLVHLFHGDSTDALFRIYLEARRHFGHGGTRRIQYTLVPLVFRALQLTHRVHDLEEAGETVASPTRKVFQFIHEIVTALASKLPEVSLQLFLQSAIAADRNGPAFKPICYEFVPQAFILYEDMADSKKQLRAITAIIGAIEQIENLEEEGYDGLIKHATKWSAKLLKKPDQCRMVALCAHLFWSSKREKSVHDAKRVLECLQRALRIADRCVHSPTLFVEMLNRYLYFFEAGCEPVTVRFVSGLLALTNEHMSEPGDGASDLGGESAITPELRRFYANTLQHIESKRGDDASPFAGNDKFWNGFSVDG